jgi:putative membrane protein
MHYGNFDGPGNGTWMWIPMMVMMLVFWGGLIAAAVVFIRRPHHTATPGAPDAGRTVEAKQTPQEILARGEIDPDDYQQRLDALHRTLGT